MCASRSIEIDVSTPRITSAMEYRIQRSGVTDGLIGTVFSRRPNRYTAIAHDPSSVSAWRRRVRTPAPG